MADNKLTELWGRFLQIIKDNISTEQYSAWFEPLVPVSYDANNLEIQVPSKFFIEKLEETYLVLLSKALHRVFGSDVKLFYKYGIAGADVRERETPVSNIYNRKNGPAQTTPFDHNTQYVDIDPQLNPRYNFENYCDSHCNKLAVSIGQRIAESPDCMTFNPMFVFGATGVGKTHLMQAIGLRVKENNPKSRVLYVTARVFESQYTTAVRQNTVNDFINFYQNIDLLILDDIQEFAGKPSTQNTFFHIFNHLHQHQKQLIMSCDTRPSELDGMEERLMSRFKWGVTVELDKPDYELRRSVLRLRAEQDGLELPDEVMDYIADKVTSSVRELEGIVVSLLAHATMLNQDITVDLARSVIANSVKINKRQLTFEMITSAVAEYYNIDVNLLYGKSRKREISDARQLIMYFAKNLTPMSSTNIGQRMSRNHATVLHACKQVEQRLSIEKTLREDVGKIEASLK